MDMQRDVESNSEVEEVVSARSRGLHATAPTSAAYASYARTLDPVEAATDAYAAAEPASTHYVQPGSSMQAVPARRTTHLSLSDVLNAEPGQQSMSSLPPAPPQNFSRLTPPSMVGSQSDSQGSSASASSNSNSSSDRSDTQRNGSGVARRRSRPQGQRGKFYKAVVLAGVMSRLDSMEQSINANSCPRELAASLRTQLNACRTMLDTREDVNYKGRACRSCRTAKRRCDRGGPSCGRCLKRGDPCYYPAATSTANTLPEPADALQG